MLTITGKIQHGSDNGDGVRGRVVSSRHGVAGQWITKNVEHTTEVSNLAVEAGDHVDFVVDCIDHVTSDSFVWTVDLALAPPHGPAVRWNSATEFHGPQLVSLPQLVAAAWQTVYLRLPEPDELAAGTAFVLQQVRHLQSGGATGDHELAALTSLCQQLLSSNEFLYVE